MKAYESEQIDRLSEALNFKGSILGYDQESCLRWGLDIIDLMFFGWLEKFMSNGKMRHREFEGDIYYNLHLDAFFKSLPICHIGADAMKKRNMGYISKGLVDKKTVQTQKGKALFIRFLEPYWNLSFDTDKIRKGISIPVENFSERDGNPLAERDGNPLALNNPTVQYPTVQNPPPKIKKEGELSLKKMKLEVTDTVCRLFKTTRFQSLMPERFFSDLVQACGREEIKSYEDVREYLEWIFEVCQKKKPDNLKKYYYTAATKDYNIADFISHKVRKRDSSLREQQCRLITCPVCNTKHDIANSCPECGLQDPFIPEEVAAEKRLMRSLPKKEREELEKELEAVDSEFYGENGCVDLSKITGISQLTEIRKRKQGIFSKYNSKGRGG